MRLGLIGFGLLELVRGVASGLTAPTPTPIGSCARAPREPARIERSALDLPLGLALLMAARRRSWRPPVLALGSLSWALRALIRIATPRSAGRRGRSLVEPVIPAVGAGTLGWLFSRAARAERWASR